MEESEMKEDEEFELTLEELEKVSGGFYEDELREEDRNHLHYLHGKAFDAWRKQRKDPTAKQEYEDAVKALHDYEAKLAWDYGDRYGHPDRIYDECHKK